MSTAEAAVKQFERLPTDVLPVNYKVELQPDLNVFTFKGKLEITAKVLSKHELLVYIICILL